MNKQEDKLANKLEDKLWSYRENFCSRNWHPDDATEMAIRKFIKYILKNFTRKQKPPRNFCQVCEYYYSEPRSPYFAMCSCNKKRRMWREKQRAKKGKNK